MGIEPTRPAWKAGILAIELHPHRAEMSAFKYYHVHGILSRFFYKNPSKILRLQNAQYPAFQIQCRWLSNGRRMIP